jgi:hypothetical protein
MKGIHLFFINFPDSLPIKYTTSNLATYLEVALRSTKYHHQDGGIPNTGIRLVLLDNGSMVDERDPSIYINFPSRTKLCRESQRDSGRTV